MYFLNKQTVPFHSWSCKTLCCIRYMSLHSWCFTKENKIKRKEKSVLQTLKRSNQIYELRNTLQQTLLGLNSSLNSQGLVFVLTKSMCTLWEENQKLASCLWNSYNEASLSVFCWFSFPRVHWGCEQTVTLWSAAWASTVTAALCPEKPECKLFPVPKAARCILTRVLKSPTCDSPSDIFTTVYTVLVL